ncbi:MAG: hypothetical protein EOP38_20660 [Rubrivivax sp.]|nr:MAG: hypothetical protein EOP38_20660 [Rubrivivax sp.]
MTEEATAILRRMEQNQLRALEIQAEHLANVKAQMARTEATVQESIALQKSAVSRQAKVFNFVLPIILAALAYVGYLLFRHA